MTSGKYPIFNRGKNPFNKNVKTPVSVSKKGSVMFDEGEGIISFSKNFDDSYYELTNGGYYDIENNQPYYREETGLVKNSWSVNYIKK